MQLVQVVGALLILAAFAAAQFGALDQRSYAYLWLNLVGAAVLTVLAYLERQWGFFLLDSRRRKHPVGVSRLSKCETSSDLVRSEAYASRS